MDVIRALGDILREREAGHSHKDKGLYNARLTCKTLYMTFTLPANAFRVRNVLLDLFNHPYICAWTVTNVNPSLFLSAALYCCRREHNWTGLSNFATETHVPTLTAYLIDNGFSNVVASIIEDELFLKLVYLLLVSPRSFFYPEGNLDPGYPSWHYVNRSIFRSRTIAFFAEINNIHHDGHTAVGWHFTDQRLMAYVTAYRGSSHRFDFEQIPPSASNPHTDALSNLS